MIVISALIIIPGILIFIFSAMVRSTFDFITDEDTKATVQNTAFGIGILFGAMSVVIALLGIWAGCCKEKCLNFCISLYIVIALLFGLVFFAFGIIFLAAGGASK